MNIIKTYKLPEPIFLVNIETFWQQSIERNNYELYLLTNSFATQYTNMIDITDAELLEHVKICIPKNKIMQVNDIIRFDTIKVNQRTNRVIYVFASYHDIMSDCIHHFNRLEKLMWAS